MEDIRLVDALVVGAGPAGLASSHALLQHGISHLVLEKGASVADTWVHLYDSLHLHTTSLAMLPLPLR